MTYNVMRALAERRGEIYTVSVPDAGTSYDIALLKSAPELMPDGLPGEVRPRRKRGGTKGVERLATLPFSRIEQMLIDAQLDLETLGTLVGGDISRPTWYRWRADFQAVPEHVISIVRMAAMLGPIDVGRVISGQ